MVHRTALPLFRGDLRIAGYMFRNTTRPDVHQPGVIVTGSWLTVQQQMPELYARRLAERGYAAFTFDFTGFGESAGEPRQAEIPDRKIADLVAAADFVSGLSIVTPGSLAHVAICASAQYGLAALARGSRVARFVSVAGWFHDVGTVAPFYGGLDGIAARLARGQAAIDRYLGTGQVDTVRAYQPGDDAAAMFFELDYYGSAKRGAVAAWRNEMATLSWSYWFTFDGLRAAESVRTPSLFVHSDGCVFPDNVRAIHARLQGPKQLVWGQGSQTDFYDQPAQVDAAVEAADRFLREIV